MVEVSSAKEQNLSEDFSEHDRLFHYTNGNGLAGILSANCLWATHFQSLNDNQEFEVARKSLETFTSLKMHERIAALKVNKTVNFKETAPSTRDISKGAGRDFVNCMYTAMFGTIQPFIFSCFLCNGIDDSSQFAYENGVLQHWGTYGRDGGYAIQINPHSLARLLVEDESKYAGGYFLRKVDYSDGTNPPLSLVDDYKIIGNAAQQMIEFSLVGKEWESLAIETFFPFAHIVSSLKHHFFKIEHEARLVLFRSESVEKDQKAHDVHIRSVGRDLVPYVKLLEGFVLTQPCPIERIVVGPGDDKERRCEALKTYLRLIGSKIPVTVSDIPYLPR